jgi:hypothetical protein
MSALDRACPCGVCGERSHEVERCPALREPLKNEEFFKPAGGRPAGGDDDEGAGLVTVQELMDLPLPPSQRLAVVSRLEEQTIWAYRSPCS